MLLLLKMVFTWCHRKNEIWNLSARFVSEGKRSAYSVWFCSSNSFQWLFSNEVKVWSIPHVEGLRFQNIIYFIVNKIDSEIYLPSNYFIYYPSRVWLCNLGKHFSILTIWSEHSWFCEIYEFCAKGARW